MNSALSDTSNCEPPANDAHLAHMVRVALGRRWRGTSGIIVSSCSYVVTLHGTVGSAEDKGEVGEIVKCVAGVEDVINKLRIARTTVP